ncbi:serine protein kinase RIO [Methanogenium organophilum]|uniref:non-specific serine/threonine protein kinase n=1 Tax=Methanogenium organophilum TaxID=2199 RepID=A0A9X9T8H9_METOG|nr:serine protein kinase RIO [Methanogenium organophilum]WAI02483.1 serine protein kinase RIO [Methanogenium organophilum]
MGKRDALIERFDRETERMGVRIRDADQMKVSENVFDDITLLSLYRLVHKKKIQEIGGPISTGKEANVFYGVGEEMPIAIKIYRIQSANFRSMSEYIVGDPRFSSVKRAKKDLIFAWTKKEYSNLARAHDAGIRVPRPVHFDRNILLMEFMGEDEVAYPQLRLSRPDDYQAVYDEITAAMKTLFNEAELVHADLSEFNILWDGEHPIIIDIGQAVTPNHPKAIAFLVRDIKNINRYFANRCTVRDEEELFRDIVGEHRMEI